jgi:hypothetical protein
MPATLTERWQYTISVESDHFQPEKHPPLTVSNGE